MLSVFGALVSGINGCNAHKADELSTSGGENRSTNSGRKVTKYFVEVTPEEEAKLFKKKGWREKVTDETPPLDNSRSAPRRSPEDPPPAKPSSAPK